MYQHNWSLHSAFVHSITWAYRESLAKKACQLDFPSYLNVLGRDTFFLFGLLTLGVSGLRHRSLPVRISLSQPLWVTWALSLDWALPLGNGCYMGYGLQWGSHSHGGLVGVRHVLKSSPPTADIKLIPSGPKVRVTIPWVSMFISMGYWFALLFDPMTASRGFAWSICISPFLTKQVSFISESWV